MDKNLFFEAIIKYISGVIIVGVLLFLPAYSLNYWNAWLLMGLLFIPMFIAGIFMMFKNPLLLRRRLKAKEKEKEQKEVVIYSGLMFFSGFIIAGLNYRYNWTNVPKIFVIIASVIFLISYLLYAEVLRENTFLERTIKVSSHQKVIDTGLYSIVRHPMYTITIFLFLSIPIILGSLFSFIIFLVYPFIIVKRIKNEEKVLAKELKGYQEYQMKVKYRLIPYLW